MNTPKNKKLTDYSDLDQEAQEIINREVESVMSSQGINWQAFEEIRLSEEKSGPPRYAANEIFERLEETGILSLREGYGAYARQGGSLMNIGPSMNAFGKYNFRDLEELKRYIDACYKDAEYSIVAVSSESIVSL